MLRTAARHDAAEDDITEALSRTSLLSLPVERVVTWNCGGVDGYARKSKAHRLSQRFIDELRSHCDVLVLQEGSNAFFEVLRSRFGAHWDFEAAKECYKRPGYFGVLYNKRMVTIAVLPDESHFDFEDMIDVRMMIFDVFRKRDESDSVTSSKTCRIANFHWYHPKSGSFELCETLASIVQGAERLPILLCGDFNLGPDMEGIYRVIRSFNGQLLCPGSIRRTIDWGIAFGFGKGCICRALQSEQERLFKIWMDGMTGMSFQTFLTQEMGDHDPVVFNLPRSTAVYEAAREYDEFAPYRKEELQVCEAWYGSIAFYQGKDVTEICKRYVANGVVKTVNNESMGGDPEEDVDKRLVIHCLRRDDSSKKRRVFVFKEGDRLTLTRAKSICVTVPSPWG